MIIKGDINRQDMALYDGVNKTVSRRDSTGGHIQGLRIGDTVDVLSVYGNGLERTRNAISDAADRAGSANTTLVLSNGIWTIDSSLSLASSIHLEIAPSCTLNISSGVTLTVNGYIFTSQTSFTSGSGTLTYNGGQYNPTIYPAESGETGVTDASYPVGDVRRYGALDGVTDDATAIANALTSSNTAYLPEGTYDLTATISIPSNKHIHGDGFKTILSVNHAGYGLTMADNSQYAELESFAIQLVTGAAGGVDLGGVNTWSTFYNIFRNVIVLGSSSSSPVEAEIGFLLGQAAATDDVLWNRFFSCMTRYIGVGVKCFDNANSNEFHGCIIRNCAKGFWFDGSANARGTWNCLRNMVFGGSVDGLTIGTTEIGVYVNEADHTYVNGTYIESSSGTARAYDVIAGSLDTVLISIFTNVSLGGRDNGTETVIIDQGVTKLPQTFKAGISIQDQGIGIFNGGDTVDRSRLNSSGLYFGSGSASVDVKLYRSAANILKTDDTMVAAAGFGLPVAETPANTNTPSGATANAMKIYDDSGALLGYIPVYSAQW